MSGSTSPSEECLATTSLRDRVEAFIYREARLADCHAYREWLELWAPDALYWVPCNDDAEDPALHVALIYDNLAGLEDRIARLMNDHAHAQNPPSRLARLIGNFEMTDPGDGTIEVHSVMSITAYRRGRQDQLAGRVRHRLRPEGDGFKLVSKFVYLVNNDGPIRNLTFIV